MSTDPVFVDLHLPQGASMAVPLPASHNAFIYVYEGRLTTAAQALGARQAGVLDQGDIVEITAEEDSRAILVAGKPIKEPVVQYGPFVMNTREEIEQALSDYRTGRLTG